MPLFNQSGTYNFDDHYDCKCPSTQSQTIFLSFQISMTGIADHLWAHKSKISSIFLLHNNLYFFHCMLRYFACMQKIQLKFCTKFLIHTLRHWKMQFSHIQMLSTFFKFLRIRGDKGYLSETHLNLKSCENSFIYNICLNHPIILKFCTEHHRGTAMLCAKFQDSWIIQTDVMYERDFARFEFMMCFQQASFIAQHPRLQEVPLSM